MIKSFRVVRKRIELAATLEQKTTLRMLVNENPRGPRIGGAKMNKNAQVLILEDVATDAELIVRELRNANIAFSSQQVDDKEAFLRALADFEPDIVLSDYNLPQFSGLEALRLLKERDLVVPFILVTGSMTEEKAVECMKEGVDDYILK